MKPYRATASALVESSAERVYNLLADYRNTHPLILPKPYFISLEVEQGGFGAGTIINFSMRVFGQTRAFRAVVSEPKPGRILVETGLEEGGVVTTFEVSPAGGDRRSEVRITTEGRTARKGLPGSLERAVTELYLKRIYKKELKLIAARVREGEPAEKGRTGPAAS